MKRIHKSARVLAAAIIFGTAIVSSAQANQMLGYARYDSFNHVQLGQHTLAPFAFTRYCVENPADCSRADPVRVVWTIQTKARVAEVNRRINRQIKPVNDVRESWNVDVAAGDCEDYALTKRRELMRIGIPTSALRIATAITSNGVGHAVLIVNTSEGDFVLDNRTNRLKLWNRTDLKFLKIASATNPQIWQMVETPVQTASSSTFKRL